MSGSEDPSQIYNITTRCTWYMTVLNKKLISRSVLTFLIMRKI